jgi:hypothetical protein
MSTAGLSALRLAPASEAFAGEVEAVGVVDQAIEDGIGVGRVADQLMPAVDRQLAGDNGGAAAVAVIEDLQKVVTGSGIERLEAPIVEDEQIDAAKRAQQAQVASVAAGERKIGEEPGGALIEYRAVVAAGFVSER